MGYRHYLYAVPKKQVEEIRACKTTKDWIDFVKRHDYRYDEDDEWFPPYRVGKELYELGKYSEIGFKLECNAMYETSCQSIGKTVFLTREEAKKALEGMRKEDEGQ